MEILILFAVVVALIWSMYLLPRWTPLSIAATYLVVSGAYGYEMFNFKMGVTMAFDRLLLMGLIVSFGWFWWTSRTIKREISGSEKLLFGFLALLIVNTFFYDWRRNTPDQVPILQHMIEGYVIPFILYWIAKRSVLSQKALDRVFLLFGVYGIYLALTALCEITGTWSLVFPREIANPEHGIHFGRARGPFLQSVRLGVYLLVCLFSSWIPLVYRNVWGRKGQLLGFMLFGLYAAAIGATYTRSIWLAFAVSAMLVALMTFPIHLKKFSIVCAVFVLMFAVVAKGNLISIQREFGAQETKESTEMRAVFAYVSWLMVKDRPIAGYGFGHYPHKNRPYLNDRATKMQLETVRGYIHHNTWLSILVELGVFGFALYLCLFVAWCRESLRLFRDTAAPQWMRGQALMFLLFIACYAIQMLFHDVSYSPAENGILFLMAGITTGVCSMRGSKVASQPSFNWATPFSLFRPSMN